MKKYIYNYSSEVQQKTLLDEIPNDCRLTGKSSSLLTTKFTVLGTPPHVTFATSNTPYYQKKDSFSSSSSIKETLTLSKSAIKQLKNNNFKHYNRKKSCFYCCCCCYCWKQGEWTGEKVINLKKNFLLSYNFYLKNILG